MKPGILFVCTANLFRSPMAAAICSDLLQKSGDAEAWRIASAGYAAVDGMYASSLVKQAMAERGLDISAHRSQTVTRHLLEQFELVLVMEARQKEILRLLYPDLDNRVVLLSQIVGLTYDIGDPDHNSLQSIQATAREIESLLKKGWLRILSKVIHA